MRTAVTVVISGLLFGVTIAVLLIVHSSLQSVEKINGTLFDGTYYAYASRFTGDASSLNTQAIRNDAENIYQQTIQDKKAEAKRLGITYDSQTEINPITYTFDGVAKVPQLDTTSPSAQKAFLNYERAHPAPGVKELTDIAGKYGALNVYQIDELKSNSGNAALMENGVENFQPNGPQNSFMASVLPRIVDESITKPFMTTTINEGNSEIPILMPSYMARQLIGLKRQDSTASPTAKLEEARQLKAKATNYFFSVCYRNDASQAQISSAVDALGGSKQPLNTAVAYSLPASSDCAPALVSNDSRSDNQKELDNKLQQFGAAFSDNTRPLEKKINFRIVGILPDGHPNSDTQDVTSNVLSVFFSNSQLAVPMVPSQAYDKSAAKKLYSNYLIASQKSINSLGDNAYIVAFSNKNDLQRFLKERSCIAAQFTCSDPARPFVLSEFGTTTVQLNDISNFIEHAFTPMLLTIVVISIIIMSGTFGRIIADSRREIAVYRSLGASKSNIASIFVVYSIVLSILVTIFSLILGILGSLLTDLLLTEKATNILYVTNGLLDSRVKLHFFSMSLPASVMYVALAALFSGVLSMMVTLPKVMRRTIIDDLRDE